MLSLVKGRLGLILGPPTGSKMVILRGRSSKNYQMAMPSALVDIISFSLGPSWAHLGLSWAPSVHLGLLLEASWPVCGPSWGHLGLTWGHLAYWGPSRPHLGPCWGCLGDILGILGGPSWGPCGPAGGHLESSWRALGPVLSHLGP